MTCCPTPEQIPHACHGECCRVISLPWSPLDALRKLPGNAEGARLREWLTVDLTPIKRRDAEALAPWLPQPSWAEGMRWSFTCRHWDDETGLCGDWENRPSVCRGFPYYGATPVEIRHTGRRPNLPERCAFQADWQPVTVKARR